MAETDQHPLVTGITLSPHATSVGVARAFVDSSLRASGANIMAEDAVLLTSELVKRALLDARRPLTVSLVLDGRRLRVAVSDAGRRTAEQQEGNGSSDDPNRWTHLIEGIATSWGVKRIFGGKAVWFELSR